ncbi:hypothetical protein MMC22_004084 [Lobaria immixta]|nr:hypothetical protein [Lobaria immixta]
MAISMDYDIYDKAIPIETNKNRWTALDSAAEKGHGKPVEQPLKAGADKGVDVNTAGREGGIPLSEASYGGHRKAMVDTASSVNLLSLQAALSYGLEPIVDFVAVHGLHGDPMNTWMSRETNVPLLKDFLPHDVPDARVMSYGYDAVAFNEAKEDGWIASHSVAEGGHKRSVVSTWPMIKHMDYPLESQYERALQGYEKAWGSSAMEEVNSLRLLLAARQSLQHNVSEERWHVRIHKRQHHLVCYEKRRTMLLHVCTCYLLQRSILRAREKTRGKEHCAIDATDGGRTCHPLRELWRRRPKALLSMLLTPSRRMWGKTADLLSNQPQKLAIPILMLWVKPASAKSSRTSERRESLARVPHSSMSSHHQLLLDTAGGFLRLWARAYDRSMQNSPTPQALLLGCFLCTSFAVIVAYIHRNDRYQTHFLIISSMLFVGEGAFFAVDVQDFVFRYSLLGVSVGLGLSALFHRAMAVRRNLSCGRWAQKKSLIAAQDEKTQGWGDEKLGMDGASM